MLFVECGDPRKMASRFACQSSSPNLTVTVHCPGYSDRIQTVRIGSVPSFYPKNHSLSTEIPSDLPKLAGSSESVLVLSTNSRHIGIGFVTRYLIGRGANADQSENV